MGFYSTYVYMAHVYKPFHYSFQEEARMDAASDLNNPEQALDLEVKAFNTAFGLRYHL